MAGEGESGFRTRPVCLQSCTVTTMLYWSLAKQLKSPLQTHHFSPKVPRESHMCPSATTRDPPGICLVVLWSPQDSLGSSQVLSVSLLQAEDVVSIIVSGLGHWCCTTRRQESYPAFPG